MVRDMNFMLAELNSAALSPRHANTKSDEQIDSQSARPRLAPPKEKVSLLQRELSGKSVLPLRPLRAEDRHPKRLVASSRTARSHGLIVHRREENKFPRLCR